MAFQYAHHRPLTPITPIHSPHPSAGSSVRMRTPGQLSLYEYRKMQVTPSPPAVPGQKTVKKKRGMSSLSRTDSLPARSPTANFFSSFQSLTTPPETPSLEPPMGFASHVSPVDVPTRSRADQVSTYPEFAHLLSLGSELQYSPPYSPPLPSLSSASRPFFSTSPYQPLTPSYPAEFATSTRPLKHPLLGSQRSLRRPWSHTGEQDRRYVDLPVEPRPRSEGVSRVDSKQGAASYKRPSQEPLRRTSRRDSTQQRTVLGSPFPGALAQDPILESGEYRRPRTSQDAWSSRLPSISQVPVRPQTTDLRNFETSSSLSGGIRPRERHFNPIKRLPRPDSSVKRRPAPLRLGPNSSETLYQSDNYTTSTSTFSLSKYPFPNPPEAFVSAQTPLLHSLHTKIGSAHDEKLRLLSPTSPSIRFSGVSFEIVNPHSSLELAEFDTPSEEVEDFPSYPDHLIDSDSDSDMEGDDGNRKPTDGPPQPKRYSSLQGAYQGVVTHRTRRRGPSFFSRSRSNSAALPDTPHRPSTAPPATTPPLSTPPWDRFDEHGQRVDSHGVPVTASIEAGPSASQAHLRRPSLSSSQSTPNINRSLVYHERVYTSDVPLPIETRSSALQGEPTGPPTLPRLQIATSPPFSTQDLVSPQEGRIGTVRSGASHQSIQHSPITGPSSATVEDIPLEAGVGPFAPSTSHLASFAATTTALGAQTFNYGIVPDTYERLRTTAGFGTAQPTYDSGAWPAPANLPFRQTVYGSEFESRSIDGRQSNVPAGRTTGITRYSQASSVYDDQFDESSHRLSEPFPYMHYESQATGQSSTISRLIERYEGAGEEAYEASDYIDEPSVQAPTSYSYAGPSSQRRLREPAPPSFHHSDLVPASGSFNDTGIPNIYGIGNGTGMPTGFGNPSSHGPLVRDIPVEEFETASDFADAVADMAHQPLLHRQDTEYFERYQALMNRIQLIRGRQARRDAELTLSEIVSPPNYPHRISTPDPEEQSDEEDHLYMAPSSVRASSAHLDRQVDLSSQATGFSNVADINPVSVAAGATVVPGEQPLTTSQRHFRPWDLGDDEEDPIEQYDEEVGRSPLDSSPTHTPYEYDGRFTTEQYHMPSPLGPPTRLDDQFALQSVSGDPTTSSAHIYGQSGPPPRQPAPEFPYDDQTIGLAMVPPLFANRKAVEQSDISSYENTGKLLGIPSATMDTPKAESTETETDQNQLRLSKYNVYSGCRDLIPEQNIPKMWSNHSPPGSAGLQVKSLVEQDDDDNFSQSSEDVAAAMDDTDEWETEPSRSHHNSAMPEPFTYRDDYPLPAQNVYMPMDKSHPRDPNFAGFYPAEELSPEPHDGFEKAVVPRSTRHGHAVGDIEMGIISPMSGRSYRSGYNRPSVRNQNSLQPLVLPRTHSRAWTSPPVMHEKIPEMKDGEKLWRDIFIWTCYTLLAPIGIGPLFLWAPYWSDDLLGSRLTKRMKTVAGYQFVIVTMLIGIGAGIGIYVHFSNK